MSNYIDVFLRFNSPEEALQAAKTLGFTGEDATDLPPDGWYNHEDGNKYYYALDVVFGDGIIFDVEGNQLPGLHINVRWRGPVEKLPDFGEAVVVPTDPACRFA